MKLRPYGKARRAIQLMVFVTMFAIPVLNLFEIYIVTGTFYALNVGGLGMADPAVILQTIFASGELAPPLLGSLLFPVLLALLLGRVWCGWMCPYHFLADGVAWIRSALRSQFLRKTEPEILAVPSAFQANVIRYGFLLAGTAVAGAIGIPVLNFVSAPGVLSTEAMILVREGAVSMEFGFILFILAVELLLFPRFWCRLFCPTGACLALIRAPFTLRVKGGTKNPKAPCCKDNLCSPACPMGLVPYREAENLLCTNCARCIDACRKERDSAMLGFVGFTWDDR